MWAASQRRAAARRSSTITLAPGPAAAHRGCTTPPPLRPPRAPGRKAFAGAVPLRVVPRKQQRIRWPTRRRRCCESASRDTEPLRRALVQSDSGAAEPDPCRCSVEPRGRRKTAGRLHLRDAGARTAHGVHWREDEREAKTIVCKGTLCGRKKQLYECVCSCIHVSRVEDGKHAA